MRADSWIAAQVKSKKELSVSSCLRSKGYETFVPTYRSVRKWSDRTKTLELPLLSGYVLIRAYSTGIYGPITTTPGVIRIVKFGSQTVLIDDSEIERFKAILGSSLPVEPYADLEPGTPIVITEGPLAGITGNFRQSRNKTVVIVTIAALHRSIAVHIDKSWIAPRQPLNPDLINPAASS